MRMSSFMTIRSVMIARSGAGLPVGHINDIYCAGGAKPELPDGMIWPEGQILSRDEYPELYGVLANFWPKPKFYKIKQRWRRWRLRRRREFQVPDFRARVVVGVDPAAKD